MPVALHHLRAERATIAVLEYEPRRARGVTLIVGHGYSSSKHNLDFLCGFLASHGYRVFSLDFPGHKLGASTGRLESIDDLVSTMSLAASFARDRGCGTTYTMGHSMGAMTALLTAAPDSGIAGTVAIATGFGRPSALQALQANMVSDFRATYVDGLALPDLMAGADAYFERALPRLEGRPQLYVAAARDAMVSARSVEELFQRAPEPKSFVTIDSDHTSAGDAARGAVLQWLNERHPR